MDQFHRHIPVFTPRRIQKLQKNNQIHKIKTVIFLQVTFSDFGVCNIASESSLEDLNSRLTNPVDMGNFRPSIVVKGSVAFDEVNIQNTNYANLHVK